MKSLAKLLPSSADVHCPLSWVGRNLTGFPKEHFNTLKLDIESFYKTNGNESKLVTLLDDIEETKVVGISESVLILSEIMKYLRICLLSSETEKVYLTVVLLDAMVKNCGFRIHILVGRRKFMKTFGLVCRRHRNHSTSMDHIKVAALMVDCIQAWGEAFTTRRNLYPHIFETYFKARHKYHIRFPRPDFDSSRTPIFLGPVTEKEMQLAEEFPDDASDTASSVCSLDNHDRDRLMDGTNHGYDDFSDLEQVEESDRVQDWRLNPEPHRPLKKSPTALLDNHHWRIDDYNATGVATGGVSGGAGVAQQSQAKTHKKEERSTLFSERDSWQQPARQQSHQMANRHQQQQHAQIQASHPVVSDTTTSVASKPKNSVQIQLPVAATKVNMETSEDLLCWSPIKPKDTDNLLIFDSPGRPRPTSTHYASMNNNAKPAFVVTPTATPIYGCRKHHQSEEVQRNTAANQAICNPAYDITVSMSSETALVIASPPPVSQYSESKFRDNTVYRDKMHKQHSGFGDLDSEVASMMQSALKSSTAPAIAGDKKSRTVSVDNGSYASNDNAADKPVAASEDGTKRKKVYPNKAKKLLSAANHAPTNDTSSEPASSVPVVHPPFFESKPALVRSESVKLQSELDTMHLTDCEETSGATSASTSAKTHTQTTSCAIDTSSAALNNTSSEPNSAPNTGNRSSKRFRDSDLLKSVFLSAEEGRAVHDNRDGFVSYIPVVEETAEHDHMTSEENMTTNCDSSAMDATHSLNTQHQSHHPEHPHLHHEYTEQEGRHGAYYEQQKRKKVGETSKEFYNPSVDHSLQIKYFGVQRVVTKAGEV